MTEITFIEMWAQDWPHDKPDHPLSLPEAHQAMQQHRACLREHCARKQAAWERLVEADHIVPDTGRTR